MITWIARHTIPMLRAFAATALLPLVSMTAATPLTAQTLQVTGGTTSLLLDNVLLSAAAGLQVSSASGVLPGALGPNSGALTIRSRTATAPGQPTTFAYSAADFPDSVSGNIAHDGTWSYNADSITVGNISIRFDADRVSSFESGFYLVSTTALSVVLFDLATPGELITTTSSLIVQGDLLIAPEFAAVLLTLGLASSDLTGLGVGIARIDAEVESGPGPGPGPGTDYNLSAALDHAIARILALENIQGLRSIEKALDRLAQAQDRIDDAGTLSRTAIDPIAHGVRELMKAEAEVEHDDGDAETVNELRDAALDLAAAVRAAVGAAVDAAEDAGGDRKEIKKARAELKKGDKEANKGKLDQATRRCGQAMDRADRAL